MFIFIPSPTLCSLVTDGPYVTEAGKYTLLVAAGETQAYPSGMATENGLRTCVGGRQCYDSSDRSIYRRSFIGVGYIYRRIEWEDCHERWRSLSLLKQIKITSIRRQVNQVEMWTRHFPNTDRVYRSAQQDGLKWMSSCTAVSSNQLHDLTSQLTEH